MSISRRIPAKPTNVWDMNSGSVNSNRDHWLTTAEQGALKRFFE
jgi:hypothetical protein